MTEPVEPISDEMLADIAERGPKPVEWCIPITKAERDALLARLGAAEARAADLADEIESWKAAAVNDVDYTLALRSERDAARARAVPDGHTRIDGVLYRVGETAWTSSPSGFHMTYLVPADTEEKP